MLRQYYAKFKREHKQLEFNLKRKFVDVGLLGLLKEDNNM